jgi:hypothetical protein
MEEMAAKLEKAKAQMADSMKNMPPQQQAMMKKLMGGKMAGGAADALPHYVKKASGEKAGKWTADRYEAEKGAGNVHKMWTVPYGTIGLKASDLDALKEIAKFVEKFGQNKSDYFNFDRKDMGFSGVPVKTDVVEKGKTVSSTLLKEAGPKSFAASTFEVPAGYTKKEMKGL